MKPELIRTAMAVAIASTQKSYRFNQKNRMFVNELCFFRSDTTSVWTQ